MPLAAPEPEHHPKPAPGSAAVAVAGGTLAAAAAAAVSSPAAAEAGSAEAVPSGGDVGATNAASAPSSASTTTTSSNCINWQDESPICLISTRFSVPECFSSGNNPKGKKHHPTAGKPGSGASCPADMNTCIARACAKPFWNILEIYGLTPNACRREWRFLEFPIFPCSTCRPLRNYPA